MNYLKNKQNYDTESFLILSLKELEDILKKQGVITEKEIISAVATDQEDSISVVTHFNG